MNHLNRISFASICQRIVNFKCTLVRVIFSSRLFWIMSSSRWSRQNELLLCLELSSECVNELIYVHLKCIRYEWSCQSWSLVVLQLCQKRRSPIDLHLGSISHSISNLEREKIKMQIKKIKTWMDVLHILDDTWFALVEDLNVPVGPACCQQISITLTNINPKCVV